MDGYIFQLPTLKKQNSWHTKYMFPTAIVVADSTHIDLKPKLHGDEYIIRKVKNVEASCDVGEMFTSVDVNCPGSRHKSRIWNNV